MPGRTFLGSRPPLAVWIAFQKRVAPGRNVANRASGKQSYAIAAALRNLGADVTLVTGPAAEKPPAGVTAVRVDTAQQMMGASEAALPVDCAVCCAAVADYRPAIETTHKIKKERGGLTDLPLTENPDILKTISQMKEGRPRLVIGFAAETDDLLGHAEAKRMRKKCDWIVANDVSPGERCAMGGTRNTVILITEKGDETWPEMSKQEVARELAARIASALRGPTLVKAAE